MPLVQFDLMDGYDADVHRALMERCTSRLSQLTGTPMDRFRATVTSYPPDRWALGGEVGAATISPMIRITLLQGRTLEMLQQMLAVASQEAADVLGVPVDEVRAIAQEIPRSLWAIGGVPASVLYGDPPPAPAPS